MPAGSILRTAWNPFSAKWGGYIEVVTLTSDCALIVNEEGRLIGLPYNCTISNLDLVGPVLAVGIDGEEFADCPLPAMRLLFGGDKSEKK